MDYFRLATDCFLVEGERDAALYDLHRSRVYLLDGGAHRIVRRSEDNAPLPAGRTDPARRFLRRLQRLGLGSFHAAPVHVDKFLMRQPVDWVGMASPSPSFSRVDWAITNRCDLACTFCARRSRGVAWRACQTCVRRGGDADGTWSPPHPEELVAGLAALGVGTLHVRGGNPLLAWDYLRRVVAAARDRSLAVDVTTPGTGRPASDLLALCEDGGVRVNLVCLALESGRGRRELLRRQVVVADAFARAGIPFLVTFLVSRGSPPLCRAIIDSSRRRWGLEAAVSEVHPRRSMPRPLAPWSSPEEFFARVRYTGCACGNFEVGSDGKLRTCAGFAAVHGDVAGDGLNGALSQDALYESWSSSKQATLPCRGCSLRYACSGCAAFEAAGGSRPSCPYAPGHSPWKSRLSERRGPRLAMLASRRQRGWRFEEVKR